MSELAYQAKYEGLYQTPPKLPASAKTGVGLEYLEQNANTVVAPLASEVVGSVQKNSLWVPTLDEVVTYPNQYMPRIWAGHDGENPLFLLGRIPLPEDGVPEYAVELGIPDQYYNTEQGAINFHRLIRFTLELTNLIQLEPELSTLSGKSSKTKTLKITSMLLKGAGAIPVR